MTNTIAAEEFQSYIGGRTAGDGAVIAWDSPALSGAATSFASASVAQVDQAVRLAHGAQMQWADMPPLVRQHFLYEFAKKIEGDAETLGRMDCTDMGKPISVAIQEAHVTAFILRYYAGAIDKVAGQVIPSVREALTVSYPRPYGVVGAMISWNYPAINAAMKFAPALAAGNAIVLKPSDQARALCRFGRRGRNRQGAVLACGGRHAGLYGINPCWP
jgi:acyl-CoA reductase-like NAD-dependent aldehyde dehydrogenase